MFFCLSKSNSLASPTTKNITNNIVATSLQIGTLEFNVTPSVSVLAGYVIKIRVPDGFSVATVKSKNCESE